MIRAAFGLSLAVLVWWLCATALNAASVLPSPIDSIRRLVVDWQVVQPHAMATLKVVVLGFIGGTLTALFLGVMMGMDKRLQDWILPSVIVMQVVPKVAFAPLIFVWTHSATVPAKAIVAGTIALFPVLVNMLAAYREVDPNLRELFVVCRASRPATLLRLLIPSAAPYILEGAKIAFAYSVVGAVTAEFVLPGQGLGHLILVADGNLDTSMQFAVILAASMLGLLAWACLGVLQQSLFAKYSAMSRHGSAQAMRGPDEPDFTSRG